MNRRLATPGALLIFAGAFLLYWGLRELGIVGDQQVSAIPTSNPVVPTPTQRSA